MFSTQSEHMKLLQLCLRLVSMTALQISSEQNCRCYQKLNNIQLKQKTFLTVTLNRLYKVHTST